MKLEFSYFQLFVLIVYFKYVKLVPDEYCLSPLNKSDCGVPPTPVFAYYKYGSRCEIEFWRGCPTENMFENEYHCSHYCIGKTKYYGRERGLWKGRDSISIEDLSFKELEDINKILHEIDKSEEKLVYINPARKPATKTTVKPQTEATKTTDKIKTTDKAKTTDTSKTEQTETTVDAKTEEIKTTVETTTEEDESEEESEEDDDTEKPGRTNVTITQEPVTGPYINKPTALKLRQNRMST
ncbi:uncharacterized protein LOC133521130 [Cydia pomonella]|uniref:uncharacterized protein LOC133521130 n=1 Tax=Cydia pomonella TaxID=82600 RepID=UPI002ADDD455|nr:uncharacterized protein LOC133521130 [Cydia pomonella]